MFFGNNIKISKIIEESNFINDPKSFLILIYNNYIYNSIIVLSCKLVLFLDTIFAKNT